MQYELILDVDAAKAWSALRQVGLAHRLFAGVLIDGRLDGDVRTVTFAGGQVVRERIIDVSEVRCRVAYAAIESSSMTHHNASMQIVAVDSSRCRFIWIADFLPNTFGDTMAKLVKQGAQALKANLESGAF